MSKQQEPRKLISDDMLLAVIRDMNADDGDSFLHFYRILMEQMDLRVKILKSNQKRIHSLLKLIFHQKVSAIPRKHKSVAKNIKTMLADNDSDKMKSFPLLMVWVVYKEFSSHFEKLDQTYNEYIESIKHHYYQIYTQMMRHSQSKQKFFQSKHISDNSEISEISLDSDPSYSSQTASHNKKNRLTDGAYSKTVDSEPKLSLGTGDFNKIIIENEKNVLQFMCHCIGCNYKCDSLLKLSQHRNKNHSHLRSNPLKCPLQSCQKRIMNDEQMMLHLEKAHRFKIKPW